MKRHSDFDHPTSKVANIQQAALKTITVSPIARLQRKAAAFRQPKEVACFSYTPSRELCVNDLSALKYYHPMKLDGSSNDLSSGFGDRYIARESAIENLDSMLEALKIEPETESDPAGSLLTSGDRGDGRPRFCTWRGIITKIMCAPYTTDTWELRATLHKGTLYIMEDPHTSRPTSSFNESARGKMMTYWGYRFEGLSTIDHDPRYLDPEDLIQQEQERVQYGVVDTHVQFCSIVKTRVGAHDVFMGAEVDCLMPPTDDASKNHNQTSLPSPLSSDVRQSLYAELKTNRVLSNHNHTASFHKNKLLKTYFQCFLAGIPKVVVGFRDDHGYVESLKVFKTLEIPRMVRETAAAKGETSWDPVVCINWADEVLSVLWKTLSKANAELVKGQNGNTDPVNTNDVVYRIKMKCNGDSRDKGRNDGRAQLPLVNEGGAIEIFPGIVDPSIAFVPT